MNHEDESVEEEEEEEEIGGGFGIVKRKLQFSTKLVTAS